MSSMIHLTGLGRSYNGLDGNGALGRRSITQSHGWWGGRQRALDLLKTWWKSWYTGGTLERLRRPAPSWNRSSLKTAVQTEVITQTLSAPCLHPAVSQIHKWIVGNEQWKSKNNGGQEWNNFQKVISWCLILRALRLLVRCVMMFLPILIILL